MESDEQNKQTNNRKRLINTGNRLTAVRGEVGGGQGKIGEVIKQRKLIRINGDGGD